MTSPLNLFGIAAQGTEFDVDAFLASSLLRFDRITRKDDSRKSHVFDDSGLLVYLGDGATLSIPEQTAIAVDYLKLNREALRALATYPGIETFTLGLQYVFEMTTGTLGFVVDPSSLLMWHCLDIGIALVYHVDLDREKEQTTLDRWIELNLLRKESEGQPQPDK